MPLPPPPSLTLCRDLDRHLAALRQQRGEAEAALQRERSQGAGRKTAAELQAMIAALQASRGAFWQRWQPCATCPACCLLPAANSCQLLHADFLVLLPACPPALPAERGQLPQGGSGDAQATASTAGGRQVAAGGFASAISWAC